MFPSRMRSGASPWRLAATYDVGITHTKEGRSCNCLRTRLCSLLPGSGRTLMARSTITKDDPSLAGIAILARLTPQALEALQRRCTFRRYELGESIVDYLDRTDEVFFIISGEVRVTIYSLAGKA